MLAARMRSSCAPVDGGPETLGDLRKTQLGGSLSDRVVAGGHTLLRHASIALENIGSADRTARWLERETPRGGVQPNHRPSRPSRHSHNSTASALRRLSGGTEATIASRRGGGTRRVFTMDALRNMHNVTEAPSEVQEAAGDVDRTELRDQMEWDLGVHDSLRALKEEQIREQILMDTRHEKNRIDQMKSAQSGHRTGKGNCGSTRKSLKLDPVHPNPPISHTQPIRQPTIRHVLSKMGSDQHETRQHRLGSSAECATATVFDEMKSGAEMSATNPQVRKSAFSACREDMPPGFVGNGLEHGSRSQSRRALFEGLANTADMSRSRMFIVQPQSVIAIIWDAVVYIALFVQCSTVPVVVSQIIEDSWTLSLFEQVDICCDLLLIVDVCVRFVTAYEDELRDILVTSPVHIARRYLKSYFVVDVVGALPLDRIFRSVWKESYSIRLIKVICIHRLVVARRSGQQIPGSNVVNPSLATLGRMMLVVVMIWHWVACLYWLMGLRSHDGRILSSTDEWRPPSIVAASNNAGVKYAYVLGWAIGATTQTNNPPPSTIPQLLFGNGVIIIGILMMSLIIGSATTAISEMQAQSAEVSMRLSYINRYLQYKRLPLPLKDRILSYYRFKYTSMNRVDENEVLAGLPRALRMQMLIVDNKPVFVQLPLFWLCSEEEILMIVQRLRPCVVMPGEMLVKQDRLGIGLFLLMKGAVETLRNGELVVVLLAVAAFGENALRGSPSSVSIRALRFCETTVLLREDFAAVESLNPLVRRWLDIYILERDRKMTDPRIRRQSQETRIAALRSIREHRQCASGRSLNESLSSGPRKGSMDSIISEPLVLQRAMKNVRQMVALRSAAKLARERRTLNANTRNVCKESEGKVKPKRGIITPTESPMGSNTTNITSHSSELSSCSELSASSVGKRTRFLSGLFAASDNSDTNPLSMKPIAV